MVITVIYNENVNLGNYESAKCGMKIQSDKEIKSKADLKKVKEGLFTLAKEMVREERKKIEEERNG